MSRAPAPSPLARAVCQGLTGAPPRGFSLLEIMLALGGMALLSGAGFVIYQGVANGADVKTEQANIQAIANNADRIQGALGSYAGMTTTAAIGQRIPPRSMVAGGGLVSRWSQPVLLEPVDVTDAIGTTKPNAGLKITYQAVPARACAKLVQAAAGGMFGVQVADQSVMADGRLDTAAAISRCADGAPVAFTYYGGASGLAAMVRDPVNLPPLNPPTAPPPVAPPPAPPPVAPPPPPPAPGCGAAPTGAASGTTPPGQTCSFVWNAVGAPTCWAPLALCSPIVAAPPTAPPPTPPGSPPPSVPPPPPGVVCTTVPASTTEPGSQTGTCPAGTLTPSGGSTFPQTRSRPINYSCPDPFDAPLATPGTWSPWSPSAGSTCAPVCVAPAPATGSRSVPEAYDPVQSQAIPQTRSPSCGAGMSGTWTQTRTVNQSRTWHYTRSVPQTNTTTYACPAPTGAYTSSTSPWTATSSPPWTLVSVDAWATTSATPWATTSNTCAPSRPPPSFPEYTEGDSYYEPYSCSGWRNESYNGCMQASPKWYQLTSTSQSAINAWHAMVDDILDDAGGPCDCAVNPSASYRWNFCMGDEDGWERYECPAP